MVSVIIKLYQATKREKERQRQILDRVFLLERNLYSDI